MAGHSRLSGAWVWIGVWAGLMCSVALAQGDQPRYLRATLQELERLEEVPDCRVEGRARAECSLESGALEVRLVVSDVQNTVYLAVVHLGTLSPDAGDLGERLARLAELDWELHGSKLEWDPRSGEIRLSALLHTDTNFDRRAFRVVWRALLARARAIAPLLPH